MEYSNPEFRKWLDKLQRESWQLELIISGFAIYGLFTAYGPVETKLETALSSSFPITSSLWMILLLCCQILIFNLVTHVLLRGLWIGAIGLRYVSGDIDYDKLNYSEKFTGYLKRKVGSFDRYIARLENYCSIMFAVSFLLIFYILGFFSVLFALGFFLKILDFFTFIPEEISESINIAISTVTLLAALVVFIDFLGQGFLKKRRWTSKLFFPIYWVFSKLTLSFLYRPLAYNFLDNPLGKKLSLWLVPIYIAIGLSSGISYQNSNYLNSLNKSSVNYANKANYDDESIEETQFIDFASIPSKVITTSYLKIFIVYTEVKEDFIFEKDKELKPEKDARGLSHEVLQGYNSGMVKVTINKNFELNLAKYLAAVQKLYTIKIDSVTYRGDFVISKNAKEKVGFESYLDIRDLKDGQHILTIKGPSRNTSTEKITEETLITIPFWYFPKN